MIIIIIIIITIIIIIITPSGRGEEKKCPAGATPPTNPSQSHTFDLEI